MKRITTAAERKTRVFLNAINCIDQTDLVEYLLYDAECLCIINETQEMEVQVMSNPHHGDAFEIREEPRTINRWVLVPEPVGVQIAQTMDGCVATTGFDGKDHKNTYWYGVEHTKELTHDWRFIRIAQENIIDYNI